MKKKKVVRVITRADRLSVNRSIAPKIAQNKAERIASREIASEFVVRG